MIDLRGFRAWADLLDQPFLRLLRQGRVSDRAFARWLAQERYLYEGMLGLQASLIRRAPQRHRLIKAHAMMVTVEELDWMLDLELPNEPVHPVRQGYLDLLRRLEEQPYAIGTICHWVRQRSFFDAWRSVTPEGGLAAELAEHWSAPESQALLHDYGSLALEATEGLEAAEVDVWVNRVLQEEQFAWDMALEFALSDKTMGF